MNGGRQSRMRRRNRRVHPWSMPQVYYTTNLENFTIRSEKIQAEMEKYMEIHQCSMEEASRIKYLEGI